MYYHIIWAVIVGCSMLLVSLLVTSTKLKNWILILLNTTMILGFITVMYHPAVEEGDTFEQFAMGCVIGLILSIISFRNAKP